MKAIGRSTVSGSPSSRLVADSCRPVHHVAYARFSCSLRHVAALPDFGVDSTGHGILDVEKRVCPFERNPKRGGILGVRLLNLSAERAQGL